MSNPNRLAHLAGMAAFLTVAALLGPYERPNAAAGLDGVALIETRSNTRPTESGTMQVWDCETLSRVVTRFSPQAVDLRFADRVVTLPRSINALEERYSQGDVTFWKGGNYARIEESGGTYVCRNSPTEVAWEDARSRGIEIRAAGEEPNWSLEIDEGTGMEFVGDSGATRVTMPVPIPEVDSDLARTTYRAKTPDHTLMVVLEDRLCWYKANSMASSATVTVTLDGARVYRGCGRPLPSGNLVGTVEFRAPETLPAGAELRMQLVRLSGEVPTNEVFGEYRTLVGSQAPIPFEISYDRTRIYGGDAYGIEATIRVNGKPRLATHGMHPVLTRGSVGVVEVQLESVPSGLASGKAAR